MDVGCAGGLVVVGFWWIVLLFVSVCVLLFVLWWGTAAIWFGFGCWFMFALVLLVRCCRLGVFVSWCGWCLALYAVPGYCW